MSTPAGPRVAAFTLGVLWGGIVASAWWGWASHVAPEVPDTKSPPLIILPLLLSGITCLVAIIYLIFCVDEK